MNLFIGLTDIFDDEGVHRSEDFYASLLCLPPAYRVPPS